MSHPITPPEVVASADDAWKEAITQFFEAFIRLLFPAIAAEVDWARGYQFLDKELAQIKRGHATGKRIADKLVQVYLRDGSERWLLIHIEVQGQASRLFNERMYIYNYRLFDRFRVKVVSVAVILAASERPKLGQYQAEQWGCEVSFTFPYVKVHDFRQRQAELETSRNPFAIVLLAQLQALEKKGDNATRFAAKRKLVFQLYERGFTRKEIHRLFAILDWLLTLPKELEQQLEQEIHEYEEKKPMLLVSRREYKAIMEGWEKGVRQGLEEGRQEGIGHLISQQLTRRFGPLDTRTEAKLKRISGEQLEALGAALLDFTAVKDLKDWLAQQQPVTPARAATQKPKKATRR